MASALRQSRFEAKARTRYRLCEWIPGYQENAGN